MYAYHICRAWYNKFDRLDRRLDAVHGKKITDKCMEILKS